MAQPLLIGHQLCGVRVLLRGARRGTASLSHTSGTRAAISMDLMRLMASVGRGAAVRSDDPRRTTPRGELRMPKFVKFHPEDTASLLNEVFWEGMDKLSE